MAKTDEVVVVSTGVANVASMMAALRRCGAAPTLSDDAVAIERAERVVLPGVGAFAAGAETLSGAVAEALQRRATADRPLLAVCLGLQLLCLSSEESPGSKGMGVFPSQVQRFSGDVAIPQIGWNQVFPVEGSNFLREGFAYFANSYHVAELPIGVGGAYATHGCRFVAAMERGSLLACQFHPELSGAWGAELLTRWLSDGGVTC